MERLGDLDFGSETGRWELNPRHQQAEEQELPGIEAFGPRAVAASQQRRQAMTQELVVLAQELDRFVTLLTMSWSSLRNGLVAFDDQALEEDRDRREVPGGPHHP